MPTETVWFDASDGVRLEGRLAVPDTPPAGAAIVCHPHPEYGGTMSSAIVPAVQRALVRAGWACLRFNFRGVGRSEGTHGGGIGELKDAAAALELIAGRFPGVALAVAGWSFGSMVGVHAAAADDRVSRYVAIAPPTAITPHMALTSLPPQERLDAWKARTLAVCGTTDPFSTPKSLRAWAASLNPDTEVRIYEGADHFFSEGRDEMARDVAAFIAAP